MRKNDKTKLHAAIDEMSPGMQTSLLALLTAFKPSADSLADLEGEAKPSRRRRAAKAEEPEEKPARRSRRSAAKDEDEKPTRRRRAAKAEEPEEDEDDEFEATLDGLDEFMKAFEGEPVKGTIAALKGRLEAYGIDPSEVMDGDTAAEKRESLGINVAAMDALFAKLVGCDKDALAELAEDVGADVGRSNKTTAMNILVEFNADDEEDEDEEEEDEDADDEDDEEDEDDETEKPTRRRRAAKAEDDDEEDEDDKPSRRRRATKDDDDEDLGDLGGDVRPIKRRRAKI